MPRKKMLPKPDGWRRPRHSQCHAETMMCLLDAFNAIEQRTQHSTQAEMFVNLARSNHGSYAVRQMLISLAAPVDKLWQSLSADMRDSITFDWEFCDDVILYLVDWYSLDGNSTVRLIPNAKYVYIARLALHERYGKAA